MTHLALVHMAVTVQITVINIMSLSMTVNRFTDNFFNITYILHRHSVLKQIANYKKQL